MSSPSPVNGIAPAESKSGKTQTAESITNGGDHDSQQIKELQKSLRNANKKLSATAKAQSVVDENPGVSLNDLVASKKLNTDQKAQMVRKPALQEQIKSLEDQIERFRAFGKELEDRFEREKVSIIENNTAEISKIKEEALKEAGKESAAQQDAHLLVLTQFLHAASSKRNDETTPELEGKAFEGVLLKIYQGSLEAIEEMKKLMAGSESKVTGIDGEVLEFTYAQVKELAKGAAPQDVAPIEESAPEESTAAATVTDPTIANAGLTELDDTITIPVTTNGTAEHVQEEAISTIPEQATIGGEAGNAVAEASWDPTSSSHESWVEVPRDPTETETGLIATPADATPASNSWAEEANEGAAAQAKVDAENDGFETVQHHHPRGGRGKPRGEFRGGRGRGEGYRGGRGRGGDGERRGGGRGRGRGGDGSFRGGRGGRGRDNNTNASANSQN